MSEKPDFPPDSPHLSATEVRKLVDRLGNADSAERPELMIRLAWRPACAIRSRRNSLKPFLALFKRKNIDLDVK